MVLLGGAGCPAAAATTSKSIECMGALPCCMIPTWPQLPSGGCIPEAPAKPSSSGGLQSRVGLRHAVDVDDAVLRLRGNPRARREDAREVQRVAGGERDALFAALFDLAHRAQRIDRFRQRELLARESLREAATADLAARLLAAVDLEQLAPRRRTGLALEQVAEDDAVAAQILGSELFHPGRRRAQERP